MSNANNVIQHDQTEPKALGINIFLIVTIILLFGIFIWCVYFYKSILTKELAIKENTQVDQNLKKLRDYESRQLSRLRWINKEKQQVQVPIKTAMDLVIKDYKK
ncbi:hypothetical protein DID77_02385 [Candidatus Marinamargulisbacteria bacterium SCGC AG-439-L15]|nr:hypothetical protein DID77_02385 [Candidatus Marinamargulisbacteria bacterium SCGC AG-439-L15]